MGELDGKVAVITGAGSGMGKASARIFVREGARVLVGDVTGAEKDTAAELGSAAVSFSCDVSKEDDGTKHAIRAMKDGGGSIVNWSSLAGLNASPMTSVYSAAKAGVVAVTKAAALEYGAAGIRANVICPGAIVTEGMCGGWQTSTPELAGKAALGRAGRSEEVAELASFLASDRASYLSGCVIPADGGWSCQLS
jgi:NAD(P)-dependent dehydrogenase (short-subunit alcohol dehydrogenase family)